MQMGMIVLKKWYGRVRFYCGWLGWGVGGGCSVLYILAGVSFGQIAHLYDFPQKLANCKSSRLRLLPAFSLFPLLYTAG